MKQPAISLFFVSIISVTVLFNSGCNPSRPSGGDDPSPTDTILHLVPSDWSITSISVNDTTTKEYDINNDGLSDFKIGEVIPGQFGYFIAQLYCMNGTEVLCLTDTMPTAIYYYIQHPQINSIVSGSSIFDNAPRKELFEWDIVLRFNGRTDMHFAAFKIIIAGQPHYAWVKFTETWKYGWGSNVDTGTVRIDESGYCNYPNTPIQVGVF